MYFARENVLPYAEESGMIEKNEGGIKMTDRLYYENSYLREFDARVLEIREDEGKILARLDRSAFYPTSGGQPFDTGDISGARVLDVFVDKAGEVWHQLDAPLAEGACVHGSIDWARRFDHMQQHAGEHILAGAVYRLLGGHTVGLHLGREDSSIDVDFPDGHTHLTAKEIILLEDDVNEHIQRDVPIRCWFPGEEELKALPLRKPPTVSEHVRVVQIGDDEFCACGGTHPSTAGQIGLVRIIDARPSKGRVRLTFVCGRRAFEDYRRRALMGEAAANRLSTGWENLENAVDALLKRAKDAEYHLNRERSERALENVPALLAGAEQVRGVRVVTKAFSAVPMDALRSVAGAILEAGNTAALLAAEAGDGYSLLFARAADVDIHIGRILSESARKFGGKGGGKPDFAQGAALSADVLGEAARLVREALGEQVFARVGTE